MIKINAILDSVDEYNRERGICFETNYDIEFLDNLDGIAKITFVKEMYNVCLGDENCYSGTNWLDAYELYIDTNKDFKSQTELIKKLIELLEEY